MDGELLPQTILFGIAVGAIVAALVVLRIASLLKRPHTPASCQRDEPIAPPEEPPRRNVLPSGLIRVRIDEFGIEMDVDPDSPFADASQSGPYKKCPRCPCWMQSTDPGIFWCPQCKEFASETIADVPMPIVVQEPGRGSTPRWAYGQGHGEEAMAYHCEHCGQDLSHSPRDDHRLRLSSEMRERVGWVTHFGLKPYLEKPVYFCDFKCLIFWAARTAPALDDAWRRGL